MKNDLKKKFLDILFEPEEEMEIEEQEISEVKGLKTTPIVEPKKEVKPVTKTVKASNVIYDNNKTSNSFINIETVKPKKEEEKKEEVKIDAADTYELKHHISPIFGNVENKTAPKEVVVKKPKVNPTLSNNKEYTGIVLSPIFGYDNSSAEKARLDFLRNKKKDSALLTKNNVISEEVEEIKLHEEPISLFDEPFDEPTVNEEVFNEPFTSEIKVIDIEGEPIEVVEEDYDDVEENIKSFELDDLDDLSSLTTLDLEDNKKTYSSNAKSFIDDLLGDKD